MRGWSDEQSNVVLGGAARAGDSDGGEHRREYASEWAAIVSIAGKLRVTSPQTRRTWIWRAEVDSGHRPGLTTAERERLRTLERENRELRRGNEILKAASAFFARELDPQPPTR